MDKVIQTEAYVWKCERRNQRRTVAHFDDGVAAVGRVRIEIRLYAVASEVNDPNLLTQR